MQFSLVLIFTVTATLASTRNDKSHDAEVMIYYGKDGREYYQVGECLYNEENEECSTAHPDLYSSPECEASELEITCNVQGTELYASDGTEFLLNDAGLFTLDGIECSKVHPDLYEDLECQILAMEENYELMKPCYAQDGTVYYVEEDGEVMFDANGNVCTENHPDLFEDADCKIPYADAEGEYVTPEEMSSDSIYDETAPETKMEEECISLQDEHGNAFNYFPESETVVDADGNDSTGNHGALYALRASTDAENIFLPAQYSTSSSSPLSSALAVMILPAVLYMI